MGCCHDNSNSGCCNDDVHNSQENYNKDNSQKSSETYICPQCGKETTLQKRMNAGNGSGAHCGCASNK